MEKNNLDIIDYPLSVLRKLGLYSEKKSKKVVAIGTIYISAIVFLEIVAIIQFPGIIKGDVLAYIKNMEALEGFAQLIGKMAFLVYQQRKFNALFKSTKYFWNAEKCANGIKAELDNISLRILGFEKFLLRSMLFALLAMYLSLFLGEPLVMGVWTMEYGPLYKLVLVLQIFALFVILWFLPSFDSVFMAFCTKLILQFKILCHCLEQLSVQKSSAAQTKKAYHDKLRLYIEYHEFLLRLTQDLQELFSPILFCEFVTIAPLICADMYALLEGKNVQTALRHGMIVLCQLIQLAFFCIPADYVIAEALSVTDAAFYSDWYSEYCSTLRTPILVIIQRSQNQRSFTAGGLIEVNSRTLLSVLRVSWSACTVVRALK